MALGYHWLLGVVALALVLIGCGDSGSPLGPAGDTGDTADLGAADGGGIPEAGAADARGDTAAAPDGPQSDPGGGPDLPRGPDTPAGPDAPPPDAPAGDAPAADANPDAGPPPDQSGPDGAGGDTPGGPDATPDAGPDMAAADADLTPGEACPPVPGDLPTVTVRTAGRYRVVDEFPGDGLRTRRVVVYLPADYDTAPTRRYPVLYMHDGQNLFHDFEATFGTAWEVDDAVDALAAAGDIPALIVVGIDNTNDRLDEYRSGPDPTVDDDSLAARYRRFLAERVKPWVDQQFRTDCRRSQTALMGSSMGGVASLAHALAYPEVWGLVGGVSNAFWYGDPGALGEFLRYTETHAPGALPERTWLDVGTAEGSLNVADAELYMETNRQVRDWLLTAGLPYGLRLAYDEIPGAIHNEAAWEARLPMILRFLYGSPTDLTSGASTLTVTPVAPRLSLTQPAGTLLVVRRAFAQLTLTIPNVAVQFEVDDPGVARVDADFRLIPVAVGATTLHARYEGLEASADIEVTADERVTITWRVTVPAATPADDGIYLAGNIAELGSWGEGFGDMRLMDEVGPNTWQASLDLPFGTLVEYKYTRGNWATVEKAADGSEMGNRTLTADHPATLEDTVLRWADQ